MLLRSGIALAVGLPLAALGIQYYNKQASERYDLSVIGNGIPTVVLVIDRSSRDANELRSRFQSVQREYRDTVQFRIADLSTPDGALFASRQQASTLTIVMIAPDGRVRNTLTGLQDRQIISEAVRNSFPALRRAS